ncbi:MAG: NADH-quinone oxidoreductase subunit H [Aigarchaeota archaeon]|nr:NADH-quinone oxidoreductase subunit H [Aigarchaeota archaeon]MCX8193698.1 NADH-quinone oxidoreductase subunit H [Nitrososphaeria archaeon]MDW7987055.1 complex I subunit 1 family protein [Nitrososphaerota archaeon]
MVSETLTFLTQILIFPGFIFIIILSFFSEWYVRKLTGKIQNRIGPSYTGVSGILQPIADFIKLLRKEDIVPSTADKLITTIVPILYFSLPLASFSMVPMTNPQALIYFEGDLIFLIFIFTLITSLIFLGGYFSGSIFSIMGSVRAATQLLGYKIPLVFSLLLPAIPASSFSLTEIVEWQQNNLWMIWLQPIGFAVLFTCMLAELEITPFDIPEAETEIVAGWSTEFSGAKLALIRLGKNIQLLLASSLISTLYLGGPEQVWIIPPILILLLKIFLVISLIVFIKNVIARFRIDQVLSGMWKYLIPATIIQFLLIKIMLGV